MGIQLFGLLLIPALLYLIFRKYYLNGQELELLLSCLAMLLTLVFDGWITYAGYLFLLGWHSIIIFSICKRTYYFDRCNKHEETSPLVLFVFGTDEQEIMLVAYAIGIWIFLRIINMKSIDFVFNGGTFLTLLNGWNCTLDQFWWINGLWFVFVLLSLFASLYLIKYETDRNNEYRKYLIDFKIRYDLAVLAIIIGYHIFVRMNVYALAQCQSYFQSGLIVRLLWFWGTPLSTIHFFVKKHGKFEMESPSQRAEKQNDLQQQLNRRQIDQQHSRKTLNSTKNQQPDVNT